MKKFTLVPPLNLNGFRFAEVDKRLEVIHVQVDDDVSECFDVEAATLIRDWLDAALPCEHKRRFTGSKLVDPFGKSDAIVKVIDECMDCGSTPQRDSQP